MVGIKEGWQCKVYLHEGYVIKKVKTFEEMRGAAYGYLNHIGKSEKEIDKAVKKVYQDVINSTKIIKKTECPKELLAYPILLRDGNLKQKRVVPLQIRMYNLIKKGKIKEAKQVIDKFIESILKLWTYGLHENTYKFHENFGILGDKVVLIDLFEIMDDRKTVEELILKRKWYKRGYIKREFPQIFSYFCKSCDKNLTVKNLNKLWGSALK